MRIEHVAIWTTDLARYKHFDTPYFGATARPSYVNPAKGFESCFLSFSDGARLEAMTTTSLSLVELGPGVQRLGLTQRTGDGYYESVIIDPDCNRIEICS